MWELNAGIDFLEFRPSEIAAAVAISVAAETKTVDIEKAISVLIQHVEKVYLHLLLVVKGVHKPLQVGRTLMMFFLCFFSSL